MEEDNRFVRVYTEYKQQEKRVNNDDRFACLKDVYRPSNDDRFSCLKESSSINDGDRFNKFSCLVDENYMNIRNTPHSSPRSAPYSPRSVAYSPRYEPYSPRESVNTIGRHLSEERRANQKPKLSCDSDYHFPELGKSPESTKSRTLSIDDFKLDSKKEMITNTYVTPIIQEKVTKIFMEKGKVTQKEVAVDGSELCNKVIVTKNTYNSWASVIKSEADNVIKYEKEVSE